MLSTQRKILLLGPSGAGKSTLCNAIFHGKVELRNLTQPAGVSSNALGETSEVSNYWCDNSLVVTDTIGFDDSRYEPDVIAEELRRMLKTPNISYEKIILCMKLGRVSAPARVYLRLLKAIFDDPTKNMILYISGCEDGTTVDQFIHNNSSDKDEDLAELVNSLICQKKIFEENRIKIENIIVGSLQSHQDAEVDRRKFFDDRKVTLSKIMEAIDTDIGKVKVKRSEDLIRALVEWLDWMVKQKILSFARSTRVNVIGMLTRSRIINVKYIYGECCICLESTERNWIITDCCHRFHEHCLRAVESEICPKCRRSVKNIAKLPS